MKEKRTFRKKTNKYNYREESLSADSERELLKKVLFLMEDLGKMGHFFYDNKADSIELSQGAAGILGINNPDTVRIWSKHWEHFFEQAPNPATRHMLKNMVEDVVLNRETRKADISQMDLEGNLRHIRVMFSMANQRLMTGIIQDMSEWYLRERSIKDQLKLTQDIIDAIPLPVFMKNLDGKFEICNEALLNLLRYDRDCFLGIRTCVKPHPLEKEKNALSDKALLESGGLIRYEFNIDLSESEHRQCIMTKSLLRDVDDRPIGIVGTLRDITEDKKNSQHIERLMGLKDAMMEITHAIMDNQSEKELFELILDRGLKALAIADHGTVLMRGEGDVFRPVAWKGYTRSAMADFELKLRESFVWRATEGKMDVSVCINDLSEYLIEDVPDLAESEQAVKIQASLCSPIVVEGEIIGLMNLDSTTLGAFDDNDLALSEYMREQLEIALTRRKLYDRVLYLSRHDELTGTYNRRYFEERAESTLKKASRYNERFCLVVFDLDGLKLINDTFGHQCGDEIIKRFAEKMLESVRETDMLARYGGDEFVGIFHESDLRALRIRLQSVMDSLRHEPVCVGTEQVVSSFSFGIAAYPEDGDSYNKLVSVADNRMYSCKKALNQTELS